MNKFLVWNYSILPAVNYCTPQVTGNLLQDLLWLPSAVHSEH